MKRVLARLVAVSAGLFLVTATLVTLVVLWPRQRDVDYVEQALAGGVLLAAQQVDAGHMDQVAETFPQPLSIVAEVPPQAASRLETEPVVLLPEGAVVTPLASGGYLRVGPYPEWPNPPLGQVGLALLGSLAAWAVSMWLALRPTEVGLRGLADAARRIEQGEWSTQAPEAPDVAEVARAFNRMARRADDTLASRMTLLHAVSHELRTPLARLEYAIHDLARAADPAQHTRAEARAHKEIDQLDALVGELLAWGKLGATETVSSSVAQRPVVERVAASLELAVEVVGQGDAWVALKDLERVVSNLLRNAALHGASPIRVQLFADGLAVEDAGAGIPEADRDRALEPFIQLDEGPGHGFGLALVHKTVTAQGGSVELGRSPLGGLAVRIRWAPARSGG